MHTKRKIYIYKNNQPLISVSTEICKHLPEKNKRWQIIWQTFWIKIPLICCIHSKRKHSRTTRDRDNSKYNRQQTPFIDCQRQNVSIDYVSLFSFPFVLFCFVFDFLPHHSLCSSSLISAINRSFVSFRQIENERLNEELKSKRVVICHAARVLQELQNPISSITMSECQIALRNDTNEGIVNYYENLLQEMKNRVLTLTHWFEKRENEFKTREQIAYVSIDVLMISSFFVYHIEFPFPFGNYRNELEMWKQIYRKLKVIQNQSYVWRQLKPFI